MDTNVLTAVWRSQSTRLANWIPIIRWFTGIPNVEGRKEITPINRRSFCKRKGRWNNSGEVPKSVKLNCLQLVISYYIHQSITTATSWTRSKAKGHCGVDELMSMLASDGADEHVSTENTVNKNRPNNIEENKSTWHGIWFNVWNLQLNMKTPFFENCAGMISDK